MKIHVTGIGYQPCQNCGMGATLRTLDVRVPAIPARGKEKAIPAGWCPLIALCGPCWTKVVELLREKATPDSSGAVSP